MEPTNRRIEGNFSQGWGMALFITLLVVGAFATAGFIHKKTYRHPRDVTAPYRKDEKAKIGATTALVIPR
ncbi:MAG TPA: hypothetical protein VFN38_14290 [Gemmatimonadaceae bacterium]|nr:hypothetical protein [Gemmatimonadaceae bacterium]